jgi:hypothetical protein
MVNEQLAVKLEAAKVLLVDVLIEYGIEGKHAPGCSAAKFALAHRSHPPAHPIWNAAPDCDCILGKIANFLNTNAS